MIVTQSDLDLLKGDIPRPQCMTKKDTYTFDYPPILKLEKMQLDNFWQFGEPQVEKDKHQILTEMDAEDKHGIITTLKLFTLYELKIGHEYWNGRFKRMFPRPEFERLAAANGFMELSVHAPFYNEINVVLGMATDDFYSSYLDDPILKERMDFIDEIVAKKGNVFDDLISLAVFSLVEGAVLYSSFAYLKSFQANGKNKIGSVVSGIDFSVRDEHCLDSSTKVLTKNGYKNITEITLDDEVVQYDQNTDTFSYTKPTKLIKSSSNESYLFKGENYSQRVTDKHRMIVDGGEVLAKDATGKESYKTVKSCDLPKPFDFVNSLMSGEYSDEYLEYALKVATPTWANETLSIYKTM